MSIDKQSAGRHNGGPNKTQNRELSPPSQGGYIKTKGGQREREGDEHRGDRPSSFNTVCREDYVTVLFSKIFLSSFYFIFLKSILLSHNQLFFHWPCVQVHRKHIYSVWYTPLSG